MRKGKCLIILLLFQVLSISLLSQTRVVKGYIFNSKDGSPVYFASVVIPKTNQATLTNESGYFYLSKVPDGDYQLFINSLGFEQLTETIHLDGSDLQLVLKLIPKLIGIQEVHISGQKQNFSRSNSVGLVQLSQDFIKRMPTLAGQSDLAQILQGLPGVNFTGDRGGQFYIRGGAPIYNKVMVDGLTVINPFHSIGFISVIDTDIISQANVYTAGYNAQFNGRLSSIIDLRTRDGNRKEIQGKATISSYGYDLLIHGPIIKMTDKDARSVSYLFNTKTSFIDKIAPTIYPWLDSLGLPYRFEDFYGKVSLVGRKGDQLSFFGHHFTDQAAFTSVLNTQWESNSFGTRLLLAPSGSKHLLTAYVGISDFQAMITERGLAPRSTRYNNFQANIGSSSFIKQNEFRWALEISGVGTRHNFLNFNDVMVSEQSFTTDLNLSGQLKRTLNSWILEPGINTHYYSTQGHLSIEPRVQIKYNLTPVFNLNLAAGLYSQDLISTISEQDIIVLFQGYYTGRDLIQRSFRGKNIANTIQKSWHGVFGINWLLIDRLKISAEAYVKDFYQLVNSNRHKIFEDTKANVEILDYLKKQFIIEKGWSYGLDFLLDYQTNKIGLWFGYSLGFAVREDEYSRFTPHYDRRHNLNILFNYHPCKSISLKTRWNLASGYPFTQNLGFYEELAFVNGTLLQSVNDISKLAVFYGPYNEGRLPWYHRLDISVNGIIKISQKLSAEIVAGIMNIYNRKNAFYLDRITGRQFNQLPFLPNGSIIIRFN